MDSSWRFRQILLTFLGLANISFLTLSFFVMYYRIEIRHPIYAVLFCDLCFTLASAIVDLVAVYFTDLDRYLRVAGPSELLCLYFLSSTWLVVAILRYLYIVKGGWFHTRFPDVVVIRRISIIAVFLIFFLFVFIAFMVSVCFGWPKVRLTELKGRDRLICSICLTACFVGSLSGSTFIYLLVLRQRGQLGKNQVASFPEDQSIDLSLEEELELQKKDLERLKAEIRAANKSLNTNLALSGSCAIFYALIYFFSNDVFIILSMVSKSVASVTTIVVNFGPVKQQVYSLMEEIALRMRKQEPQD